MVATKRIRRMEMRIYQLLSTLSTDPKIYVIIWLLLPTILIITLMTIDVFRRGIKESKRKYIIGFPLTNCLILILFGPVSCAALIVAYKNAIKKEREKAAKMFPWWQLKEYGGWK